MKKISILLAALAMGALSFTACNKHSRSAETATPAQHAALSKDDPYAISQTDIDKYPFLATVQNQTALAANTTFSQGLKIKFSFRWDGCWRPLGVCLTTGNPTPTQPPTPYQYTVPLPKPGTGDGVANVYIINSTTLAIFPDQDIHCSDFTVPITDDIDFTPTQAAAFRKTSIKVLKGRYQLHSNYDTENFLKGYILVSCVIR